MSKTWDLLSKLNENPTYEYCNDTELTLADLEQIQWKYVSTETAPSSSLTADTFINPENTIVKKVFSDGFVEYYETQ